MSLEPAGAAGSVRALGSPVTPLWAKVGFPDFSPPLPALATPTPSKQIREKISPTFAPMGGAPSRQKVRE